MPVPEFILGDEIAKGLAGGFKGLVGVSSGVYSKTVDLTSSVIDDGLSFVAGRFGAFLDDVPDNNRFVLDFVEDSRPVSGKTGFLNSPRLNRRELSQFGDELNNIGINFEKNADRHLNKFGQTVRGGFDWEAETVFLRRGATKYEAFHEFTHAKQFSDIGKDAYINLGRYARESHVFNQVFKNRHQFSYEERIHAVNYMKDLKQLYQRGRID